MMQGTKVTATGTPIPRRDESKCGTGTMRTYQLPPEELADVRKRTARQHELDTANRKLRGSYRTIR